MKSAANAARCLMGIAPSKTKPRIEAEPVPEWEDKEHQSNETENKMLQQRAGRHCTASVAFLRRTYQQTRLVMTQHALSVPDSDSNSSDSDDGEPGREEPEEPEECLSSMNPVLAWESVATKTCRQPSKPSVKAKEPVKRKDVLWGKVQAMFEGARLAMRHREKALEKMRETVKATVDQRIAAKRVEEAVKNVVDAKVLASLGLDPATVAMFREILQDAAEYKTLDHMTFAQSLLQAVLGKDTETQDLAYFELQDSLLDASQEGVGEEREQQLESLMWTILTKVDELKESIARARDNGLEINLPTEGLIHDEIDLHEQRSREDQQFQEHAAPQSTEDIQEDRLTTAGLQDEPELPQGPHSLHSKEAELLETPVTESGTTELGHSESNPEAEEELPASQEPLEEVSSEVELRLLSLAETADRQATGPRTRESARAVPRRQFREPAARVRQVATEKAIPVRAKEPTHRHAATLDSFFEAGQQKLDVESFLGRPLASQGGPMMVIGQARLPSPAAKNLPRVKGGAKNPFPVMPMYRVTEAPATPARPRSHGSPPGLDFGEGTLQSSRSFSRNKGSGRFDYALSPVPVSQVVRPPPVSNPPAKRRGQPNCQTPPSAVTSIDWFPLPGTLEEDF